MLVRYAFNIKGIQVDDTFHALEGIISEERYKKMQRYYFEADKIRSLFAEVLLRYALKKHYGLEGADIQFDTNEYGKPSLKKNKNIYFNVSHSGDWILCAISSKPVGVDVEQIKEKNIDIAERFYAEEEYQTLLKSKNASELFFVYWTLKESYVKAEGKGMSISFSTFAFDVSEEAIVLKVNGEVCHTYQFQVYKIAEDFEAATCSMEPIEGFFEQVDLEQVKEVLIGNSKEEKV